uniref:Uncharacterized protein n=1 Tax=Babesia bovis TaxID=5865 RepID=S6B842_BABBO|nr:hypothetical protein [Babesia bovis]
MGTFLYSTSLPFWQSCYVMEYLFALSSMELRVRTVVAAMSHDLSLLCAFLRGCYYPDCCRYHVHCVFQHSAGIPFLRLG